MESLFEDNKKLVEYVYRRYFKKYFYLREDLLQEGLLALYKATRGFESDKGSFGTYAYRAIKNSMLGYVRQECKYYDISISENDCNFFGDKGHIQISTQENQFNEFMEKVGVHIALEKAVPKKQSHKKTIICDWIKFGNMATVAKKNDVSTQYVSIVIKCFKDKFTQEYEKI